MNQETNCETTPGVTSCKDKHEEIFRNWAALPVGESFLFENDHDPVPLYHQFKYEYPNAFTWEYLERGPDNFKVKITRLAETKGVPDPSMPIAASTVEGDQSKIFDVRPIPGRVKHQQIFDRWLGLEVGDYFILLNDHDPVPLRYQFQAEYPGAFTWEYEATGPEEWKVRIAKLKGAPQQAAIPEEKVFDVRPIPGRVKHQQIFDRWLGLEAGDFFVLLNDHDPMPLRYQFAAEYPNAFSWDYLEQGPIEWRVKIGKTKAVSTPVGGGPVVAGCGSTPEKKEEDPKVLDARPIPGRIKHATIFDRWLGLEVGDYFILLNDHDPVPLRYQFDGVFPGAFTWDYLANGPEEFRVKITKLKVVTDPRKDQPAPAPASAPVSSDGEIVEVDGRDLEPPMPLVRVLDAIENLKEGQKVKAITDREPYHLFREAESRGFKYQCNEEPDGSWITILERA